MGKMMIFLFFAKNKVLYYDESGQYNNNLTVPMYTYTRTDMGHQYIMDILLSLGIIDTEVDLTMHRMLLDALCYAILIGTGDEN